MSRNEYNYNYPNLQRTDPQAQHGDDSSQTSRQKDNRYSWADTALEEQSILRTPDSCRHPNSIPPLPVVPEHLSHEFQMQQQAVRGQSHPTSRDDTRSQPQQRQPSHRHDLSKQQEAALYQRSNQLPTLPKYSLEPLQEHEQLLPAEEEQYDEEDAQEEQWRQPHLESHSQQQSQSLGLAAELSRDPEYTRDGSGPALAFDSESEQQPVPETDQQPKHKPVPCEENPLIPVSPTDQRMKTRSLATTTNTSGYPSTPTNYHFASYTPAPQATTGGSWIHKLYSCSEPSICLTGLFCPCILYGRTQHRLHLRSDRRQDATNMLGHSTVNGSCMAWALLCGCGIGGVLSGIQKSRVRRAYDMSPQAGNVFSDCLQGCCCCCCVLAQNEKEILHREEKGRMGLGRSGREGYASPMGMSFEAPPRS